MSSDPQKRPQQAVVKGNHSGFILLDEPGQHSMPTKSQLALLQKLSAEKNLQSIVAASFDDSEAAYKEGTHNVQFKLVLLGSKAIVPGGDSVLAGVEGDQGAMMWAREYR